MLKLLPHLFSIKKQPKAPPYLIHFIEQKCNAICPHCFVYSDEYKEVNSGKNLTVKEIEKVCASLKGHLYSIILTGGEPLLRKDLEDICRAYLEFADVNILILCTNGWFTDKTVDLVDRMTKEFPNKSFDISISLDDIEERHDEYRGTKGGFDRAMKTYLQLNALGRKNLSVHINLTASTSNTPRLVEINKKLRGEYGIKSLSINPASGFAKDGQSLSIDRDEYMSFMNSIKDQTLKENRNHKGGDLLSAKDRIVKYDLTPKTWDFGYQTPCYAGSLSGVIHADGSVYPCERLLAPIGNLKDFDFSFQKIWKSQSAQKSRHWIKKTKCVCDHECFMGVNILFNPVQIIKLIKEYCKIKIIRIRMVLKK